MSPDVKQIKKSMLKKGSYGYAVEVLQKYFDLPDTGNFDEQLELKVKEFQSLNNSKPDGIVGPMTYKFLGL